MVKNKKILIFIIIFATMLFVSSAKATEISSCTDLNSDGETYLLTADIINPNESPCIQSSANNTVLDCQGYTIDVNTSVMAISLTRTSKQYVNITVKNCYIIDCWYGLYSSNVSNITFFNSTVNNCSSGVRLNGNDSFVVNNTFNFVTTGITTTDTSHSVISNNIAFGNSNGIRVRSGSYNNTVANNLVRNSSYGIRVDLNSYNYITNNNLYNNTYGVRCDLDSYNFIINNTISNNTYGIRLNASSNDVIHSNKIYDNVNGIYLRDSTLNRIYNNLFNQTTNTYFYDIYDGYWNTTYQAGINIWNTSFGYIGGNLWTNSSNNDFSDNCIDQNANGFCDDYYNVSGSNNVDYIPIAKVKGQYATTTTTTPPPNQAQSMVNTFVPFFVLLFSIGIGIYIWFEAKRMDKRNIYDVVLLISAVFVFFIVIILLFQLI